MINVIIYDPKQQSVKEYYTNETVRLGALTSLTDVNFSGTGPKKVKLSGKNIEDYLYNLD